MFLPDFSFLTIFAAYAMLAIVMIWVGWRGGGPERACVLILVSMLLLQISLRNLIGQAQLLDNLDWPTFIADIYATLALALITLFADRVWTIRALTLQGLTVVWHFLQAITEMAGYTFVALGIWPTMLIMPLVLIGTEAHQWRIRTHGRNRDWVPLGDYKTIRDYLDL